jgi:hypothetical protein
MLAADSSETDDSDGKCGGVEIYAVLTGQIILGRDFLSHSNAQLEVSIDKDVDRRAVRKSVECLMRYPCRTPGAGT